MLKKMETITACVLLSLLIASLLPVIYLGRYNHPTGDDYYYGVETKAVWEQTGSLAATVAEAARGVAYQYKNWQGTYSSMLLMYLPPNIFSEWAYRSVTGMLLLLLVGSIFYLLKPVICVFLRGSRSLWVMASSLVSLLCVQTVPSQGETFFWYNGSMYYTGYYAVTLFFFGVTIRYLLNSRYGQIPLMVLIAAFLAGGNYVSLLPTLLILACLTGVLALKKSKSIVGVGCTFLTMGVGLLVSAIAPGNAIRQSEMWKQPAWKAILKSLWQGGRYLTAWTGIWLLLTFLILTPFLWRTFAGTALRFRYPLLVVGLCYGIFCSMSCPTFYMMNSTGPARAVAIVYYGYILTMFLCYGYLLGYLHRITEGKTFISWSRFRVILLAAGVLLLGIQLVWGSMSKLTTVKAVKLLINGEAAAYEREYQDRMQVLTDDRVQDVVFRPYEHQPDMLYVGDFTADAQHETNQKIAKYFHKTSLRVEY